MARWFYLLDENEQTFLQLQLQQLRQQLLVKPLLTRTLNVIYWAVAAEIQHQQNLKIIADNQATLKRARKRYATMKARVHPPLSSLDQAPLPIWDSSSSPSSAHNQVPQAKPKAKRRARMTNSRKGKQPEGLPGRVDDDDDDEHKKENNHKKDKKQKKDKKHKKEKKGKKNKKKGKKVDDHKGQEDGNHDNNQKKDKKQKKGRKGYDKSNDEDGQGKIRTLMNACFRWPEDTEPQM